MNIEEAWIKYCAVYGMDSRNANTFAIFKAGWEKAIDAMQQILRDRYLQKKSHEQ